MVTSRTVVLALSTAGAMRDYVDAYRSMYKKLNIDVEWIECTKGDLKLCTLIKLLMSKSRIVIVNGEYHPKLLVALVVLRFSAAATKSVSEISLTWHDVEPHSLSIRDLALWILSAINATLVTSVVTHNRKFLESGLLRLFADSRKIYLPLPPIDPIAPTAPDLLDSLRVDDALVFFGRKEPYKGLDWLVSRYPTDRAGIRKLIIVGRPPERLAQKCDANPNIFIIDAYLLASELQWLLSKAGGIVMPYKQYTQSNHPYWAANTSCAVLGSVQVISGLDDVFNGPVYEINDANIKDLALVSSVLDALTVDYPRLVKRFRNTALVT